MTRQEIVSGVAARLKADKTRLAEQWKSSTPVRHFYQGYVPGPAGSAGPGAHVRHHESLR